MTMITSAVRKTYWMFEDLYEIDRKKEPPTYLETIQQCFVAPPREPFYKGKLSNLYRVLPHWNETKIKKIGKIAVLILLSSIAAFFASLLSFSSLFGFAAMGFMALPILAVSSDLVAIGLGRRTRPITTSDKIREKVEPILHSKPIQYISHLSLEGYLLAIQCKKNIQKFCCEHIIITYIAINLISLYLIYFYLPSLVKKILFPFISFGPIHFLTHEGRIFILNILKLPFRGIDALLYWITEGWISLSKGIIGGVLSFSSSNCLKFFKIFGSLQLRSPLYFFVVEILSRILLGKSGNEVNMIMREQEIFKPFFEIYDPLMNAMKELMNAMKEQFKNLIKIEEKQT